MKKVKVAVISLILLVCTAHKFYAQMVYEFDGNWKIEFQLPKLNRFTFNKARSQKTIPAIFEDFSDPSLEPSAQQLNALNFVLNNEEVLVSKLEEKVIEEWNEIYKDFELEDYSDLPKKMSKSSLKRTISISEIFIHYVHKGDYSFIGLVGNCAWDEEHGIGVLFYQDSLLKFGSAEDAYSVYDVGAFEPDNSTPNESNIPTLYPKHPVFNTYKPSHRYENERYGRKLIKEQMNKEFIELIEGGHSIDYIPESDWQKKTYLIAAIEHDNSELFDFIVNRTKNLNGSVIAAHKSCNIEVLQTLFDKGANIEEKIHGKNIFTDQVKIYLNFLLNNRTNEERDLNYKGMLEFIEKLNISEEKKEERKSKFLHPTQRIELYKNYLEWLKKFEMKIDVFVAEDIKFKYRSDPQATQIITNELKWIKAKK